MSQLKGTTRCVITASSKLEAVVLMLLEQAKGTIVGRTKLMKLLYYVDFIHYKKTGFSVTNARYTKLPYGPVPKQAFRVLESLSTEGKIIPNRQELGANRELVRYELRTDCDVDTGNFLGSDEILRIEEVFRKFGTRSTSELVELTHGEEPWIRAEMGETIPMTFAKFLPESI